MRPHLLSVGLGLAALLAFSGCDAGSPLAPQPREVLVLADSRGELLHLWDTRADSLVRSVYVPAGYPTGFVNSLVTAPDSGHVLLSSRYRSFLGGGAEGQVLDVDLASGAVTVLADFPAALAVAGDDVVAVRTEGAAEPSSIYVLTPDGFDHRGKAPIRFPLSGERAFALHPDRSVLYAVSFDGDLIVYDYASERRLPALGPQLPTFGVELVLVPRPGAPPRLHPSFGPVIDTASGEEVGFLRPSGRAGLALSPALDAVVAHEYGSPYGLGGVGHPSGPITLHHTGTGERVGEIDAEALIGREPYFTTFSLADRGRKAYVFDALFGLYVFDLASRSLIAEHSLTFGFERMTTATLAR